MCLGVGGGGVRGGGGGGQTIGRTEAVTARKVTLQKRQSGEYANKYIPNPSVLGDMGISLALSIQMKDTNYCPSTISALS